MDSPEIYRERAALDYEMAHSDDTTDRKRQIYLESAKRWEDMADAGERFDTLRVEREAASRARVEEAKRAEAKRAPTLELRLAQIYSGLPA